MGSNNGLDALAALASASGHQQQQANSSSTNNAPAADASSPDVPSLAALRALLNQDLNNVGQNAAAQLLQQALGGGWNNANALAPLLRTLQQQQPQQQQPQVDLLQYLMNSQQQHTSSSNSGLQQQAMQLLMQGHLNNRGNATSVPSKNGIASASSLSSSGNTTESATISSGDSSSDRSRPRVKKQTSPNTAKPVHTQKMPPPVKNKSGDHSLPLAPTPGYRGRHEEHEDKRQIKRAANRKSAQASRKRKKLFIEELKEENDDLRRKEQILRSIPDLIVVFDSSGKLWFVSESVERFLSFTASELEGTSFWERLSMESVRILKAAFMDSLAARHLESDTAPLGTGVWDLQMLDKDENEKNVSLHGVVHFAGDRPECVCTIRPKDAFSNVKEEMTQEAGEDIHPKSLSEGQDKLTASKREAVRISDSGASSVGSECASSDGTGR